MKNHCRIFGIMAREAPVCSLFRRGPSKWTQLIKWRTNNDTFEMGDWFKGRIYERRCDLSPDGRYLIYFASKFNSQTIDDAEGYTYAWTAISAIPKFTAITLWPKGDCWHGGGLFDSDREIWLNHRPEVAQTHPKHSSSMFTATPNPAAFGEDDPVYYKRIERDGWTCVQQGKFSDQFNYGWKMEEPEIWEKSGRSGKKLRRELLAIDFRAYGGPYVESFSTIHKNGSSMIISDAEWAELDQKGKLVFARQGRIFRGTIDKDAIKETELIDLNSNRPLLCSEDSFIDENV